MVVKPYLSEDKNQDHAHKETWLLGCSSHPRITHNADGKACSQSRQAHTQASSQVHKATANNISSDLVLTTKTTIV